MQSFIHSLWLLFIHHKSDKFRRWEAVSGFLALRFLERKYAPEFAFLLVLAHEECFADSCSEETDSENEERREEEKERRGDLSVPL
jgi:hypothetical protein